jgi:hypothetical protein
MNIAVFFTSPSTNITPSRVISLGGICPGKALPDGVVQQPVLLVNVNMVWESSQYLYQEPNFFPPAGFKTERAIRKLKRRI